MEEHDKFIMNQINKYVKVDDILYHLGDVGMGQGWKEKCKDWRASINCKTIHLILGNHDHVFAKPANRDLANSLFASVNKLWHGNIAGRTMVLSHYAMRTWAFQGQGSIHCYGHSHSTLPDDPHSLSMDVGLDCQIHGHTKYTPYSAEEIFSIMDNPLYKQQKFFDHHGPDTNPC